MVSAFTIAGFAGEYHWFLDLFSHFRLQYFAILTILSVIFTFLRRYSMATFLLVFTALNYYVISPYVWTSTPEATSETRGYRLLVSNVLSTNDSVDTLLTFINETSPDIVLLMEIDQNGKLLFEELRAAYPHQVVRARQDNYGIGIYSRYPIANSQIMAAGNVSVPVLNLDFDLEGQRLSFYGIHAIVPVSSQRAEHQRRQFESIADQITKNTAPVVVAGDLNTTQWSVRFRNLLSEAKLHDPSRYYSILTTWPVHFIPLSIPIDHFLHSDNIVVTRRIRGPAFGSDHYPFIVDFAISDAISDTGITP